MESIRWVGGGGEELQMSGGWRGRGRASDEGGGGELQMDGRWRERASDGLVVKGKSFR